MCQDIKACTLEDENAFSRYWQAYQSQHDGMPPHNVEALDEGKMEADLKDGGLPAYPPGWRPPLPKEKVGTKTPPEELAGDLDEASGEAPVAGKGGTGTPSFKRIGTAIARRLHGVGGGEGVGPVVRTCLSVSERSEEPRRDRLGLRLLRGCSR